ncbi:MAG: hypothetical protein ABFE01_06960 [Phycisphaerales bacterium]
MALLTPPLALAFSVVGVLRDERKLYAAIMLAISGAITLYFLWAMGFLRFLFC